MPSFIAIALGLVGVALSLALIARLHRASGKR